MQGDGGVTLLALVAADMFQADREDSVKCQVWNYKAECPKWGAMGDMIVAYIRKVAKDSLNELRTPWQHIDILLVRWILCKSLRQVFEIPCIRCRPELHRNFFLQHLD